SGSDEYLFVPPSRETLLTSEKQVTDQRATAIRTAYPRLHRRPENVALVSLLLLILMSLPIAVIIVALVDQAYLLAAFLGLLSLLLLHLVYRRVLDLAYSTVDRRSLALFPAAVLYHVWLLHVSMYKYEFREVLWKGRNVCIPAMHVVPHLPKF
ncbi:MAG TPA: hypothetical protein VK983_02735, partial [Candidatus Limnocylindrales bacterium]|nr:hypothetical protein [Candidatus Limnocylindrales bacterium]